ncbi:hypothetical protein [uncultured Roseobacter sp.]|uniref:hypothetical protein n=1 Tax=uncultured Roseobacter sp. TaxID=114847 RepID=UPI00262241A3|nr:hypothetical protein [uncultured Roseobacter sp.]
MSRMSELMIDNPNTEQERSAWLIDLLEDSGMGVVQANDRSDVSSQEEYDAVRYLPEITLSPPLASRPTAIELKVYRWKKDWVSHFRAAADHLSTVVRQGDFAGGILVVTLDLEGVSEPNLFSDSSFPIEVWDLGRLRRLVHGNDELEHRLAELVAATLLDQEPLDV